MATEKIKSERTLKALKSGLQCADDVDVVTWVESLRRVSSKRWVSKSGTPATSIQGFVCRGLTTSANID